MRKAKPKKRVILPDPVYGDVKVTKFVNNLMYDGKKSIAYSIFYNSLALVEKKMKDEEKSSLEIWKKALENITPQVEVKSRRIGGATFQVPTEIRPLLSPANVRVRAWLTSSALRLWTPSTSRVVRSNVRRICTAWLRLTEHSHTSDSNLPPGGTIGRSERDTATASPHRGFFKEKEK